jgi:hypothetical protein
MQGTSKYLSCIGLLFQPKYEVDSNHDLFTLWYIIELVELERIHMHIMCEDSMRGAWFRRAG